MTVSTAVPIGSFLFPATYNCCVEVVFETYSSIACSSTTATMDDPLSSQSFGTETYTMREPCTISDSLPPEGSSDNTAQLEYIIYGALGLTVLILVLLQVLIVVVLVHLYVNHIKPIRRRFR